MGIHGVKGGFESDRVRDRSSLCRNDKSKNI